LNGVEHANFFETRATEYSKASTRGDWGQVWNSFDNRKKKSIIGIEAAAENDGMDMFEAAGVAAE
jgi:ribonucleoside-diphosphate reductase beta chain